MKVASIVDVISAEAVKIGSPRWLVAGKGPSVTRYVRFKWKEPWRVITLNHAAAYFRPFLAHFADTEAAEAVIDKIPDETWICLPWHPHVNFGPTRETLADMAARLPWLHRRSQLNRVCSYNAHGHAAFEPHPVLPVVHLELFSATAVFSALGQAGQKQVWTAGIDGGTAYSPLFDEKDRLANGQPSFDLQLPVLHQLAKRYGLRWTRLPGSQGS